MLLLTLISLFFIPAAKSGAALAVCPACATVCIIPFNPLCILCIISNCIAGPIVTACFSPDTTISKLENGEIKEVSIYELKENDLVLANNENKFTKVVRNVKSEGIFDYIQIILESGKELTVTNEHGVIVIDEESNRRVIKARNLREGQVVITGLSPTSPLSLMQRTEENTLPSIVVKPSSTSAVPFSRHSISSSEIFLPWMTPVTWKWHRCSLQRLYSHAKPLLVFSTLPPQTGQRPLSA